MAITVNQASSALLLPTSTANPASALSDANASQDRFLKLLVAQLNNQDPMNPMDNAQMTSQMAQINTVSGIQQLNETMKSMASQLTALQALQGTSMIGHDVLVKSNTLSINGTKANGAVELAGPAENVKIEILSPSGQVLQTINLGSQSTGRHAFEWDASGYNGTSPPTFKVTATNGGKAVANTALARDTVVSIGSNGIELKGRAPVYYDQILGIL